MAKPRPYRPPPPGPPVPEPPPVRDPVGPALAWVGVGLYSAGAVLLGLLEVFLVPLYAGATLVPVAVVLAVLGNIAVPLLSRSLVGRPAGAVIPVLTWFVVVVVVGLLPRPEGDVILPGGGGALEWNGLGVLFGGVLAGAITAIVSASRPVSP